MGDDRKLVQTREQLSTRVDGEQIILHSGSEKYFGLNEVGTRLWEALEEPRTVDELVATIQEEFDVSEERSRNHVESFIDDLKEADLIEAPDGEGS